MDYRATLNLPQTKFKMKANLSQREPLSLKRWEDEGLYDHVQEATAHRPLYILHDGPPYANGHIHLGTAFNKVLKDIVLKSKRMAGHHCPYVPGWDCHGLPIEHNVDKEFGARKRNLDKLAFRGACRDYARKWIKIQKEEFKRLGVLGDWERPYLTINYDYEASIAREFNRFLLSGAITRSKKPVYWCTSCRTALAEAEVEYHDHSSPSIYVKFPVADDLGDVIPALAGREVSAIIWTTTPWTLPANLAVAFHPDFTYAAVTAGDEAWLMAEGLAPEAMTKLGIDQYEIIATFKAEILEGRKCRHPFMERESLMILAPYVTMDAGTGCVHTAPGHGREDYLSGVRYNLPVFSPVDDAGCFTDEAGPYAGLPVTEANRIIVDDLAKGGHLLQADTISHSYPHCWRCKKPVIFRATAQWFISMEEKNLRVKAGKAVKEVSWTPGWGMERISGMIESRPDWCLSRQRAWGVPLTVFYCRQCGAIVNDEAMAETIVKLFEKEGADAWFNHDDATFLGAEPHCPQCGSDDLVKENDILDVWFDSGVSYAAVLEKRDELRAPADLYLEGSDQHRGWFQSSLLASVGTRGWPPYHGVLTHGFVVDSQGKKMSKSIGNVIAPSEIIKQFGAEILRLWVTSADYRDDIKVSDEILKRLSDAYRKIRNTIRFLLGNLYDFRPRAERVACKDMTELDRWGLYQFEVLKRKVAGAYEKFEFHTVYHAVYNFCVVTMSSLYLDIIKDRLYTAPTASQSRKAAQTVLYEIACGLLLLMAPILSFTAEEAWGYLPDDPDREDNVFVALFPENRDELIDEDLARRWDRLLVVRSELTKALESARRDKVIGHSLEAELTVAVQDELAVFLRDNWQTLKTILIVSDLILVDELPPGSYRSEELPDLYVMIRPAAGRKCERCWIRSDSVGRDSEHPQLCSRCLKVVGGQ